MQAAIRTVTIPSAKLAAKLAAAPASEKSRLRTEFARAFVEDAKARARESFRKTVR